MNTEIEVKFLDIDHDVIRSKLQEMGALLEQPMRLMRRVTIDTEQMKSKNAFLRIRDEGHKVTVTYKQFDALSVDGAKEIEMTVDDFETAINLFGAAGLPQQSFQESKRETWRLGDTEIVLDVWPWLNPYIEIESTSEDNLKNVSTDLELEWKDAVFGDVMVAYKKQYPHIGPQDTVGNMPYVRFDDPIPKFLKTL
jgi:adenylate cyclase class 2